MMNNNTNNNGNSSSYLFGGCLDCSGDDGITTNEFCFANESSNATSARVKSARASSSSGSSSASSSFGIQGGKGTGGGGLLGGGGRGRKQQQQQQQRTKGGGGGGLLGEEIDQVGSRELGLLTPQQRERIFDEIHGVCDVLDETPEFVTQCLEELEYEIQKIRNKSVYMKALFLAPCKVKNPKFRLMFLRSTGFDPMKSATKIVKHFQYKSELFGIDKVVQKITLQDLTVDDRIALETGAFQFLPNTDRAHRSVVFTARNYSNYKTWQNEIRSLWYSAMVALEDDQNEIQKYGTVTICHTMDCPEDTKKSSREILTKFYMLRDGLPIRRNAIHFCYNNVAMKSAMIVFRTIAGSEFRMRFRDHYGSFQEVQYQLMTFGIDPRIFPLDDKGILLPNCMNDYIEERMKKEAIEKEVDATNDIIYAPTSNDVLLGRGKPFQGHSGNLQLVKYLEERLEEYVNADRFQKTYITWEMVKMIQSEPYNGRFLEKDDFTDTWKIVSDDIAREKCSSGFRSMKKIVVARGNGTRNGRGSGGSGGSGGDEIDSSKRMKHNFTMM